MQIEVLTQEATPGALHQEEQLALTKTVRTELAEAQEPLLEPIALQDLINIIEIQHHAAQHIVVVVQQREAQHDLQRLEHQPIEVLAAELEVVALLDLEVQRLEAAVIDLLEVAVEVQVVVPEVQAVLEVQAAAPEVQAVHRDLQEAQDLAEEDHLLEVEEDSKPTNLIIY